MAEDIQQNIKFNYTTNIETMTVKTKQYNKELGAMQTKTQTFQRNLNSSNKEYALMGETVSNTSGKMGGFQKALLSTGLKFIGITALINLSIQSFQKLVQWVGQSITKWRDFEQTMAKVSTALEYQEASLLPMLQAQITYASTQYGQSATEIAKAMNVINEAAFDVNQSMVILNQTMKTAVATATSLTQTADILTSIMNSYGFAAETATEISDMLFYAMIRGKFTFETLASALGYVTPQAAEAGVEFKQLMAVISGTTRQGQHLDSVTRGLALTIKNLQAPTDKTSNAAKKYGIELSPIMFKSKGLIGVLTELKEASEKYGKHIINELIPNVRSARVITAALSDVGLAGILEDYENLGEVSGLTENNMAKMMNTAKASADIIAQSQEKIERAIGQTWSNAELWWKKAQLWWASLFGGKDPNAAVAEVDATINRIRLTFIKAMEMPEREGPSLYERLLGDEVQLVQTASSFSKAIDQTINDVIDFNNVIKYVETMEASEGIAEQVTELTIAMTKMQTGTITMQELTRALAMSNIEIADFIPNFGDVLTMLGGIPTAIFNFSKITDGSLLLDKLVGVVQDRIGELNTELEINQMTLDMVIDDWNEWQSALSQLSLAEDNLNDVLKETKIVMEGLEEEIGAVGDMYDGTLGTQLKYKENVKALQDEIDAVTRAKEREKYAYEITDPELQKAIARVREYEQAQTDLKIAMEKNEYEIMKIQYRGMARRRGLTRAEQKAIKKYEIENTKLRIEQMEQRLQNEEYTYEEAEKFIDDYLWDLRDRLRIIEELNDTDIEDLRDTIKEKESLWQEEEKIYKDTTLELNNLYATHITVLRSLFSLFSGQTGEEWESLNDTIESDIVVLTEKIKQLAKDMQDAKEGKIPEGGGEPPGGGPSPPKKSQYTLIKTWWKLIGADKNGFLYDFWGLSSSGTEKKLASNVPMAVKNMGIHENHNPIGKDIEWRRGTHYIPETKPYMLHKYEQVVPAGKAASSVGDINININVEKIEKDIDLQRLAAMCGEAVEKRLFTATGKSKYRRR